jgi:large subunit ribosomal protein L22
MSDNSKQQNMPRLVTASARDLHLSPRKMRLVTNLLKGMQVDDAMVQLQHLNKKGAPMVAKALRSAVANAKNNFSLETDRLYIKSITADMGKVMKRYFPRARGSAFVIRRKLSHVNIVLEERKKSGTAKRKFDLFKASEQKHSETSVDQKQATSAKPPKTLGRKSEVTKTEEQVKENRAQNKRRLFNRKAGE